MGSSVYVTVVWDGDIFRQEHALDSRLSTAASSDVVAALESSVEVVVLSVT